MSPISEMDLDRLADYTAGLLDEPERVRIDRLIATDPTWREAHAALVAARPRLDAALSGLGAVAMPANLAARLDAALAAETGPADGRTTATVIDLSKHRRWRRLAAGTAAAAAAVAAIFGGVAVLSSGGSSPSATSAGNAGSAAQGLAATGAGTSVLHSGTDYTPQNLAAALGAGSADSAGGGKAAASGARPAAPGPQVAESVPDSDLARLDNPAALHDCLNAIVALRGGQPTIVDFARYQGRPALIVVLTGPGVRRIVVVGPECGAPGAGAAELYSATQ
ncbi:MAG: hypothetical protein AUI14_20940 [Actinobacteria bacterium 13_2_20CM_2_71_6]|nr:MAG: hypothetical protein AUI14_20940 [Actinobacteria bacterium 13_2_20CM_2_71_6]